MKRRDFIKIAAMVPVAAAVDPLALAQEPPARPPQGPPPGGFPGGFPGRNAGPAVYEPTGPGIQVRFLGTGGADWRGPAANGELRRHASILADGKVLFDLTASSLDMIPAGLHPEVIFYTHSHDDHYDPAAALELGIKRAYLGDSWVERAREDFRKASEKTGKPAPEIIPVSLGKPVEVEGLTVTPLPANHASNFVEEETLIYLIEKDSTRLLYATDTGGLTARAAGYAGIGQFSRSRKFLTGIIMEATMSMDYPEPDFRMFSHSSAAMVRDTVEVLSKNRRYIPVEGQKVWLTHLSKAYHTSQAELDASLPDPFRYAYDGLEIVIR